MSSFFRLGDTGNGSPGGEPAGPAATPNEAALATLTTEISALRLQVEFLTRRLTGTLPDQTSGEPPPGQDTAPTRDA